MLANDRCDGAADRRVETGVLAHPCFSSLRDLVALDGWISTDLFHRSAARFRIGIRLGDRMLDTRETDPALRSNQHQSFCDETELSCIVHWAFVARLDCFLAWNFHRPPSNMVFADFHIHRFCNTSVDWKHPKRRRISIPALSHRRLRNPRMCPTLHSRRRSVAA